MRIEQLKSAGKEPLGEGKERKVFVDPNREGRVIAETKEEARETPRQLKGRYYLTKIVHLLYPDNIPDIYQVGEAKEEDGGAQTIDRERVVLTTGHQQLQEAYRTGGDTDPAAKQMAEELGDSNLGDLDEKLEILGLEADMREISNYNKDELGNVKYLESFQPWVVIESSHRVSSRFDEENIQEIIEELTDASTKAECLRYLERLLALREEEEEIQEKIRVAELPDCRERVGAFEKKYEAYFSEETLTHLNAITSVSEALADIKRKSAKLILIEMQNELTAIKAETNITNKEYAALYDKRTALVRAIGALNNGTVDHSR